MAETSGRGPYAQAARLYRAAGWLAPLPLGRKGEPSSNFPVPKGFTGYAAELPDAEQVERWAGNGYGANNIGLHLAPELRVIGIDVDAYDGKQGDEVLARLVAELGPLPATVRSTSRGFDNPSGIRFYRLPEGVDVAAITVSKIAGGIEIIRAQHRYAAAWPSVSAKTGEVYEWYVEKTGRRLGRPPLLSALPELPDTWVGFLSSGDGSVGFAASGLIAEDLTAEQVRAWLGEHGGGDPCRAVRGVLKKQLGALAAAVEEGTSRYDTAVEGSWALISLAAEEHLGVREALSEFGKAYRAAVRDEPGRDPSEWARMVTMGVAKAAALLAERVSRDGFDFEQHPAGACPEREAGLWPGPAAPLEVARRFVDDCYRTDAASGGLLLLRRWRGDFYVWTGRCFEVRSEEVLRAQLGALLAEAEFIGAGATAQRLRWNPTPHKLSGVLGMLPAVAGVLRPDDAEPDCTDGSAVPMANGVLDVVTRTLHPHSPERFVLAVRPFAWEPGAKAPAWREFLASVWPDDAEQVALLQEWFGYVVSGDVSLQKMLLLIGPTRSGKGVITRALEALLGKDATCSLSLDALATNFGLSAAIGRNLIVVPDARFDGRGQAAVVERLLTVSGNDSIGVDRKNREPWQGRLGARVMVVTNELPMLSESSGALVGRFVGPCETEVSWLDREDTGLDERITAELPGLFRWAMAGYVRLMQRQSGRFTAPVSAKPLRREWSDLNAPCAAFVRECCVVEDGARVRKSELYGAYLAWSREHGRHEISDARFARDLRSVLGRAVESKRAKTRSGERVQIYEGIKLAPEASTEQL